MDPVMPVLAATAAAMANTAVNESTKHVVGALWQSLIAAVKGRFGDNHKAPVLVERLGDVGGDKAKVESITQQLEPLQIGADPAVLAIVQQLVDALKNATGDTNAGTQQMHSSAGAAQAQGHATVLQGNTVYAQEMVGAGIVLGSQHINKSK